MVVLPDPIEFEWDDANINKNRKHDVNFIEAEEPFFDPNKVLLGDFKHLKEESRYLVIGKTKSDRLLFIVFTIRKNKIRVISARDLNKKEEYLYEETT